MPFCHACGTGNPDEASFCGACGSRLALAATGPAAGSVTTDPPATASATSKPAHPTVAGGADAAKAAPSATSQVPATDASQPVTLPKVTMPQVDLTRLLAGDWFGAARVAATSWATAVLLIVGLLAIMHPNGATVKQFLIGVALILSSAFGGDIVASASADTATDFSYRLSAGAYPLTVTLAALAVAMWLFRRQTRGYTSPVSALFHALRASLVFALLIAVPVIALRGKLDIPTPGVAAGLWGGVSGELGGYAASAIVFGFGYFAMATGVTILWRREWLPAKVARTRDVLAAPASGVVAMVVSSVGLGALVALATFIFVPDPGQNTTTLAVLLAILPNLGFGGAMVGGGVGLRGTLESSPDKSSNVDKTMHLTYLADHASNWVWVLVAATVVLFAVGALVTALRSASRAAAAQNLLTWVALTAVTSPLIGHFVGLHVRYSGSDGGSSEHGSAFFGLLAWQVFLLAAVASFVAAVVGSALLRGRTTQTTVTSAAEWPTGGAVAGPVVGEVGDF